MRQIPAVLILGFLATGQALGQPHLPIRNQVQGTAFFEFVGYSLSGMGDLNADGVPDYASGIPGDDTGGTDAGQVRAFSGAGGLLWSVAGLNQGDNFGYALANLGDVNGDGINDLAASSVYADPNGNFSGRVDVLSGATGARLWFADGDAAGDLLGASVGNAGDHDADGINDLVVGAYASDLGGVDSGMVRVYSGATGAVLLTIPGPASGCLFGKEVDGLDDVDSDGVTDLAVGSWSGLTSDRGLMGVYSGANGSEIYTVEGQTNGDRFGEAVATIHDMNGDGKRDILVGAPEADPSGLNSGRAYVLDAATGGTLHSHDGEAAADRFSDTLGPVGDVDGDGIQDYAVGAWANSNIAPQQGSLSIFSGQDGHRIMLRYGNSMDWGYGYSMSSLGDINGDGLAEFVAGSPYYTDGPFHGGRVRVESALGATSYGPTSPLQLAWAPGAVPNASLGALTVAGGTPSGLVWLGVSFGAANQSTISGTLLLNVTTPEFLLVPIFLDGVGTYQLPIDLYNPPLAEEVVLAQAYDVGQNALSNGLGLLFSN